MLKDLQDKTLFATWLDQEVPAAANVEYWTSAGKSASESPNDIFCVTPSHFAFDNHASTKPFPMATACALLADEMDKDGSLVNWLSLLIFLNSWMVGCNSLNNVYVKGSSTIFL